MPRGRVEQCFARKRRVERPEHGTGFSATRDHAIRNIEARVAGRCTHAFFDDVTVTLGPDVQRIAVGEIQQTKGLAAGRRHAGKHMRVARLTAQQPAAILKFCECR